MQEPGNGDPSSIPASRLQRARHELASSLATLEQRIAALHSRSLLADEQRLLDRLTARFARLAQRHAALEATLESESRAGTSPSRTDNLR